MITKTAANDSGDFARWALSNLTDPLPEAEIRSFITHKLGLEIKAPRKPRGGPRFQVGDEILIKKDKHKNAETAAVYEKFHGKVGEVIEADSTGVTVKFKTGGEGVFPDAQKLRGVGIYKYLPPFVVQGSPAMEMVYLAEEKEINDEQKVIVDKYLSNGRTQARSGNYYSGFAFSASVNQGGQVYFSVFPQQRVEVDPESERGFLPRSFNPTKGQVVYMGLLGKRPLGWDKQWAQQNGEERAASLRSRVIRLAHSQPELRPALLPLLKAASAFPRVVREVEEHDRAAPSSFFRDKRGSQEENESEAQAREILEKNLEPLKRGYWKPPHNLALNFALMGANLWTFTILPLFWKKQGYRADLNGIVIQPIWRSVQSGTTLGYQNSSGFSILTPDVAQNIVSLIGRAETIQDTVREELRMIEMHFGIEIPSQIKASLASTDMLKVAKRRWRVDTLNLKKRLIPFDGSKPRDLGTFD